MISCTIGGLDATEDRYSKDLKAELPEIVYAVKGIEFGAGFKSACGSENNDGVNVACGVCTRTNNCGTGPESVMGMDIEFRVAIKPYTIRSHKYTDSTEGCNEVHGRHGHV